MFQLSGFHCASRCNFFEEYVPELPKAIDEGICLKFRSGPLYDLRTISELRAFGIPGVLRF